MTNSDKDILNRLKQEADQSLFENIDFHSELKEKVRKNVKHSKRSKDVHFLINLIRKNRVFSTTAVVTIIFLSLWSTTLFRDSIGGVLKTEEPGNSNFSTFQSGDSNTNWISDPNEIKSWELKTKVEVKELFGDVLLPNYTPENYILDSIHINGPKKEKVIFTYIFKERSYLVIIEKKTVQNKPIGYEIVEINGTNAYLKTEESAENMLTELYWYSGDYHYMINGLISSEEAVKVAKSFD